MNYIGVSVTKDLACIAVVGKTPYGNAPATFLFEGEDFLGKHRPVVVHSEKLEYLYHVMFTYTDGRAFRGVPYFNRWRPEFCLHDNDIEDVEFGRALGDVCDKYCTQIVGYDSTQPRLLSRRAVPIAKDSPYLVSALKILNEMVRLSGTRTFGANNSAIQYMWESLPIERVVINGYETTERVFPHGNLVPRGRYDIIRAFCNAIAVKLMVENNDVPWRAEEKAEEERLKALRLEEEAARLEEESRSLALNKENARIAAEQFEAQRLKEAAEQAAIDAAHTRAINAYWEMLPPEATAIVEIIPPGMKRGNQTTMTMAQALPLLKSGRARFRQIGMGWERYAWKGFKQ